MLLKNMTLYIDSRDNKKILLELQQGKNIVVNYEKNLDGKKQGDVLLVSIDDFLKNQNIDWSQIKKIKVNNVGGSFTGLRLSVIVASSLAYAKKIKLEGVKDEKIEVEGIEILKPFYDREPDIGISKKNKIIK